VTTFQSQHNLREVGLFKLGDEFLAKGLHPSAADELGLDPLSDDLITEIIVVNHTFITN
jgi:hypothetical protein